MTSSALVHGNGALPIELMDAHQAGLVVPTHIVKRDGRVVPFDIERIESALTRCFANIDRTPQNPVHELARRVVNILAARTNGVLPTVEGVQDIVETVLQAAGEFGAAKHYILYRAEHAKQRVERPVPEDVRRAFAESDRYFPTPLQRFQFFDKYSRFNYDLGRRETWVETVNRSVDFFYELAGERLPRDTYERMRRAILEMRALPSMRLLAMAGPAARRNNITVYNCSYQPVESIDSFIEALIISMCGCGVGYSVERRYVENFPRIRRQTGTAPAHVVVEDSAEGWATALRTGLETWFDGGDVRFDLSQVRTAGAPLRTKGGRASGPEPLRVMLEFTRARIFARQGSFLRPIDAHDIMCAVGNAAVSGGVRRTALISLFDYDDDEMRLSKSGDFERENSQRWNANNSVVWHDGGLTQPEFIRQFLEMVDSERGEPGIFSRVAANTMLPARRKAAEFGVNPCGEINLRPWEFCNLSAAVARVDDTFATLREKVEVATIIGSIQSMATHFPGLRPMWQQNCEEERLLGVDITGQMDSPVAQDAQVKRRLRELAIEVNRQVAAKLAINPAAAITCTKPSGNCRPWYSLTATSSGLLTLQELFNDHPEAATWAEVKQAVYALQGEERAKIVRTYNNGVSPTLRIRMNYGLTVESTPHHRWFVAYRHERGKGLQPINEWVPAIELRPDDVLDVKIGAYTSTAHAKLQRYNSLAIKMRGNAHPINQPVAMNEDLAWLLGYLWGDGSLSPGGFRIRFIDNRQENLRKAQRILSEQFAVEANMYSASEKRHAWTLEVASVYLWHWLIRNDAFKYFADTINIIPQCVRASARGDIIAFIAGLLDSDGWSGLTHNTRVGKFTLTTADKLFAQHIQDVSWAVGLSIGCSLNDAGESLQNRREMYLLSNTVYVEPDAFAVLLRNSNKLQATAALAEFTRWEWDTERKRYHVGKITEITPGESVPTYDIEVEGNHWFYAGAVRSHNSSQLVDCASGLHSRWAPYYVRNVRVAAHSPIFKVLRDAGVPMDPENGQTREHATTWVIHFPVKAPDKAVTRRDRSAIEQCEYWLQNKLFWTEHNPSCFTGETRVVTDRGLLSFRQMEDYINGASQRTPKVLGKDGTWITAEFRALGEQTVWELEVERCGTRQIICTTADHLWPVTRSHSGTFALRTTRNLLLVAQECNLLTVNPSESVQPDLEDSWNVVSVRNTNRREPVYCMEVMQGEPYFTLEGNILTHNCTITYRPDEIIDLMRWVWEHREQIGGLSFLPAFDARYDNMPYVEISRAEYERLAAEFPDIDFSKVYRYEEEDLTTAAQELACVAGICEL